MGNINIIYNTGSITTSFDQNTRLTKCAWTIQNDHLKKLKDLSNGSHIESDRFQTSENDMNATWYLRCYPNGYNNKYAGRCQIFVYLSSLSNTYNSIRIYYYINYVDNNASVEGVKTFAKVGDGTTIHYFPLLSELQYTNQIVFSIGIKILKTINNKKTINYELPLCSIKQPYQIKWH
eukprot:131755_1